MPKSAAAVKKTKKGRVSMSSALFDLSSSIMSAAEKLCDDGPGGALLTTPQRHTAAVWAIEEEEDLSDEEMLDAVELIRERVDVADVYLTIKKKERRTQYLVRAMAKFVKDDVI